MARLLDERWSCRAFRPEPLPQALIEHLLQLAQRTASWCNTQPWRITVTSGSGTVRFRQAMQAAARSQTPQSDIPFPPGYQGVHLARRRESGYQLYDAVGVPKGDRAAGQAQALRNFDFFDAPHVLVLTVPRELGPYALLDGGAWVGNFLLAAQAHGLGAIPQAALASHSPAVRSHFGLPEDELVACGISFGRADTEHPANGYRTTRAPLAESVRWVTD
ncbi:MAG: nitroreductase [Comamonadaceae bacterium]|nr:MAG: nitroreductase [Comamonadaceae bacterium]